MEFLSKSEQETAKIASDFIKQIKPNQGGATIVGLSGELGSGKTTFMKYVAEALGVKETIQSPTFIIMKKYKTSLPRSDSDKLEAAVPPLLSKERGLGGEAVNLIHLDAYRIEKDEEMLNLGWQEIIADSQNLIFIEWPEKISKIMPSHIVIRFEHGGGESERKIIANHR